MNQRTKRVFRGFLELSPVEQTEFIGELYKFLWEKEESRLPAEHISEFGVIALGPFQEPGVCPCCGRPCEGLDLGEGARAPARDHAAGRVDGVGGQTQ